MDHVIRFALAVLLAGVTCLVNVALGPWVDPWWYPGALMFIVTYGVWLIILVGGHFYDHNG